MRALRMARDLRFLPRREVFVDVRECEFGFCFEARDFVGNRHRFAGSRDSAQLLDLGFQFSDGLFEV